MIALRIKALAEREATIKLEEELRHARWQIRDRDRKMSALYQETHDFIENLVEALPADRRMIQSFAREHLDRFYEIWKG